MEHALTHTLLFKIIKNRFLVLVGGQMPENQKTSFTKKFLYCIRHLIPDAQTPNPKLTFYHPLLLMAIISIQIKIDVAASYAVEMSGYN